MESHCLTPVIRLKKNSQNETDIIFEDIMENVLTLNGKFVAITVVFNEFNKYSNNILEQVLNDLHDGLFLKNYYNGNFVRKVLKLETFNENISKCSILSSKMNVENTPLLLCTSVFNFQFSEENVNVLCFVIVSDNLAFAKNSRDLPKSRSNFANSKNLRYEQLCIVNSISHVLSSIQLFQIPLKFKSKEINPNLHLMIMDHYLSYVHIFSGYAFSKCLVGLVLESDGTKLSNCIISKNKGM